MCKSSDDAPESSSPGLQSLDLAEARYVPSESPDCLEEFFRAALAPTKADAAREEGEARLRALFQERASRLYSDCLARIAPLDSTKDEVTMLSPGVQVLAL